ncbi:unnamed protein product [Nyctereutes procyonoides]|uniref:Dolichyl-diphosphooligosaccharide-protein glycosyltransferase subunit TMEM258 n=1 Tax=Nyctereutes procyonoides TaxID=34880 RepID=A0A811Z344_NYCPR|nr:unnamed protein product [Nyctereutes procyonoides]
MELQVMSRYTNPAGCDLAVFPHLTMVLSPTGMFFTTWFSIYEVTSTKGTWDLYKELFISLVASLSHRLWNPLPAALPTIPNKQLH